MTREASKKVSVLGQGNGVAWGCGGSGTHLRVVLGHEAREPGDGEGEQCGTAEQRGNGRAERRVGAQAGHDEQGRLERAPQHHVQPHKASLAMVLLLP